MGAAIKKQKGETTTVPPFVDDLGELSLCPIIVMAI
jgi:hypothetical protein